MNDKVRFMYNVKLYVAWNHYTVNESAMLLLLTMKGGVMMLPQGIVRG